MGFSSFSSNGLARAFSVTETRLLSVGFLFPPRWENSLSQKRFSQYSRSFEKVMSSGGVNLCNELQYGVWASTCLLPFVFPLLYTQTVNSYFDIPIEIYKVWKYSEEYDSDTLRINRKRSIVMDVEIFRKVDDPASERITGKASEDVIFGQWFQRMIDDCNLKSPSSPIVYKNEGGAYYEWVFYTKPSFFKRRFYIDPDLTLADNRLKQHDVIIAKRVANELVKYNEF